MIIDHIGIAVRSITEGIEHWKEVFEYKQITDIVVNSRQKVKVVFLAKKNSLTVKLIEPVDETSPIYDFARKGGGLHHLCFKCSDLEQGLEQLKKKGLRVLAGPQPGEAFENENIAFVYAQHGLNIELIDTDKKSHRFDSGTEC
jgi:methylmalonyl-CoA/ethylmalonyl-CoA epimerase